MNARHNKVRACQEKKLASEVSVPLPVLDSGPTEATCKGRHAPTTMTTIKSSDMHASSDICALLDIAPCGYLASRTTPLSQEAAL
eukprot:253908-Pleurochrysis_carterae.AAC.2